MWLSMSQESEFSHLNAAVIHLVTYTQDEMDHSTLTTKSALQAIDCKRSPRTCSGA